MAFNHGDFTALDELLAPDSSSTILTWRMLNNRVSLKQLITSYRLAFPDLHCIVRDEIRVNDKLAGHLTMRGTHEGLFMGNPPTGKQIQTQGIIFARGAVLPEAKSCGLSLSS
jgi:predicted ester cyclase